MGEGEVAVWRRGRRKEELPHVVSQKSGTPTESSVSGACSAVALLFIGFCQNDRFYVLPGERYF